ncbi:MAG: cAMP-activated global transcriptional regulator CRP [Gammaproteobacteria bacterium]
MSVLKTKPVSDPAIERFLHFCHKRRYPKNYDILKPGDMADRLYYIVDGSISISMKDPEDREIILAYLNKGDFIGEIGVFYGPNTRQVTVRTRADCTLAEITYPRFHNILRGELAQHATDLLLALGSQLAGRLLQTSRKVGHLAFLDVTGRIAKTLIDLCKEPDAMTHPQGMQIRITRQEIGRIVGCSREMAGRVLKELEQEGLISARGKTIVVYGTR